MQKINLYRYEEEDGSITITPKKRNETDTPYKKRLIVDEGYILTDGEIETPCIDIDFSDENKWNEVSSINEEV